MALNDTRAWPNVHPENVSETAKVNQAYIGSKAEKKLLNAGMQLYKFNTRGRGLFYNGNASPWWFPTEPFGNVDVGLEGVLKFANTMGVSSTEYARLIAAVTEEWNAMDVIMKVKLKVPVYGFWGQCTMQAKTTGSKINLTGRAYQLYIPGLTDEHVSEMETITAPGVKK
jgi:hypothetical protein